MTDYRENYFIAREIVANELKQKYNLIESYKDDNCLTLDSATSSIHLTFIIPDGDDVYISEKGKEWFTGKNFMYYVFKKFPLIDEAETELKKIFLDQSESTKDAHFDYSVKRLERTFRKIIQYLEEFFIS